MDNARYYGRALPEIRKVVTKDEPLEKIADLMKSRIEVFPDITDAVGFFQELPEYDPALYTHKKMKTDSRVSLTVLKETLGMLSVWEDYSCESLKALLGGYIEGSGRKTGQVLWPLRIAVSGLANTPGGAYEIMEILGKEESLSRIRRGIALLEASL
jgi:glutamyl-tRNA synthetase